MGVGGKGAAREYNKAAASPDGHNGTVTHALLCRHADSVCASIHALETEVRALRGGVMSLQFTLRGDLRRIRVPPAGAGERADELWRHTCFEAFVRRDDAPGYLELNVSPSGAWQAYRFSDYRQGREPAELPAPHVTVGYRQRADAADPTDAVDDALVLEALIRLPSSYAAAPNGLRLGASAVVEDETGTLSYWALRHVPGRPDFHHPDAFALALAWN